MNTQTSETERGKLAEAFEEYVLGETGFSFSIIEGIVLVRNGIEYQYQLPVYEKYEAIFLTSKSSGDECFVELTENGYRWGVNEPGVKYNPAVSLEDALNQAANCLTK